MSMCATHLVSCIIFDTSDKLPFELIDSAFPCQDYNNVN